jgi:ribose transport system substrate-binding protein
MAATVRQDPYGQGKAAVEAALTLLAGTPVDYSDPDTRSIFFPVEVVTAANVDAFMP